MSDLYYYKNKPSKCPVCKSKSIVRIQYGYPINNEKLEQMLLEGKIVLGGCCRELTDPHWRCTGCDLGLYREQDNEDVGLNFE